MQEGTRSPHPSSDARLSRYDMLSIKWEVKTHTSAAPPVRTVIDRRKERD
jgi:hypothetical protein